MKKKNSYHFSIPFEYIAVNHGNDNYDIETAYMECDVQWDDINEGYTCHYYCPKECNIDRSQGNGAIEDFFEDQVKHLLKKALEEKGIDATSICLDTL